MSDLFATYQRNTAPADIGRSTQATENTTAGVGESNVQREKNEVPQWVGTVGKALLIVFLCLVIVMLFKHFTGFENNSGISLALP